MRKPVLLIGMMGCGKSTVGRLLAERMRLPLIDLDEEIARAAGKPSPKSLRKRARRAFARAKRRRLSARWRGRMA